MLDLHTGGIAAQAILTFYSTLAGAILITFQLRREVRRYDWRRFLKARIRRAK